MKQLLLLFILIPILSFSQTQIGQTINGEASGDLSGSSVAISLNGSIIAIGAQFNDGVNGSNSGHVRVYENVNSVWTQIGQDIDGEASEDKSGNSIALSSDGSIIAVGAPSNTGVNGILSGHVRVYENVNSVWTQIGQDIDGDEAVGNFSRSIDLSSDGNIIAISSNANPNDNGRGYVKVYENINNVWTQIGQSILGEDEFDNSGISIDLSSDGSIIAIGAPFNNGVNGNNSGHVRVYENINNVWTQIGQDIDGEAVNDESGSLLALSSDGSTLAIGAPKNETLSLASLSKGHIRVYKNISGTWTQLGGDIDGQEYGDNIGSGFSLSSDGEVLAVRTANTNGSNLYFVTLYKNISGVWTQVGQNINGQFIGDDFGFSMKSNSDGSIVAIGAPNNNGQVLVYNLASELAVLEVVEDILGNNNGINVTAEQLNSIDGVSGAIDGVNYTTALQNGSYADSNNPTALEIQTIVNQVNANLSIDENNFLSFRIYPNPAKNQFRIQLENPSDLKIVNIYNNIGQLVLTSKETIINTLKLASGLYTVEVETTKGKNSKKLIIQ